MDAHYVTELFILAEGVSFFVTLGIFEVNYYESLDYELTRISSLEVGSVLRTYGTGTESKTISLFDLSLGTTCFLTGYCCFV